MTAEALREEVSDLRWYHTIDLGNGVVTPGYDPSPHKLERIHMPDDLTGQTVLDVGAWDGFFSFEAKRRGATRVLATDSFIWQEKSWGSKRGFELARRVLKLDVEDMEIDVLDLSLERPGPFDLVLFLGVLYHMRHPLLALERVAEVTRRELILETHVDMLGHPRPVAAFYPETEVEEDETNWWGPNPAAVEAMLKAVGFRRVDLVWPSSRAFRAARAVRRALRTVRHGNDRDRFRLAHVRQGRAVFHAFK